MSILKFHLLFTRENVASIFEVDECMNSKHGCDAQKQDVEGLESSTSNTIL